MEKGVSEQHRKIKDVVVRAKGNPDAAGPQVGYDPESNDSSLIFRPAEKRSETANRFDSFASFVTQDSGSRRDQALFQGLPRP
jgi:hypothetical protein